mgnify:CR=1 FL=1
MGFGVSNMLNNLQNWFENPLAIVGMVALVVGLSMIFLARNIARFARKAKEVSNQDKIYVVISILGVAFVLLGFILIVFNCVKFFG